MRKLFNRTKTFLGLKGSWKWACRQMDRGKVVKRDGAVSTKYRLDREAQRRIQWAFTHRPFDVSVEWRNANIFLRDFDSTDWQVCDVDWEKDQ